MSNTTPTFATRIENVHLATMRNEGYGSVENAVVLIDADGVIGYAGASQQAPTHQAEQVIDGAQGWLTPGLIDCHTHLVWAGSRANEFAQRLHGVSYQQIAEQGGGINATVQATRAATREQLLTLARQRAQALMAEGVTTIEIKSGYGLDLANERKQLQVARQLGEELALTVTTTLLAAHALPQEYQHDADAYIELICDTIIPTLNDEGLVDAVDAFCESIGFDLAQTERVFAAAAAHQLPIKLHAEQITNMRGAELAAKHRALSADHLEQLDESGVKAMAASGTVAVLLPGAFYFLRDTQQPPIALLRQHGVPIALATDANPGSSPIHSLLLMLQMAATLFRLTPEECLRGVTCHAAQALGFSDRGEIAAGKRADLVLWDIQDPAELTYQYGVNPLRRVWVAGQQR
ncbi:imidazolonepropionase [Idiomarina xiamenensis]|uniref:Imidazolonepropionase n=1 Tax=Idiomarina xiamenensis 10-D-4 TaxID=740709 RepID=K2KTD0_9GAMM|nr:imidazolonepropionase [Idiomarina xiamenensis]EKE80900.1 imidazolonepropionase [Idiomarina xiamenensis 10-D-4]